MSNNTITAQVGPDFLTKASRLFDGSPDIILAELLQNSRRAGAKNIKFKLSEIDQDRTQVILIDDGHGIEREDFQKLLTLSESKWDESVVIGEEPAGMGVFCLASRGCTIASSGYQTTLTPQVFAGLESAEVVSAETPPGTAVTFYLDLPSSRASDKCREASEAMTVFDSVEITGVWPERRFEPAPFTTTVTYLEDLKVNVYGMAYWGSDWRYERDENRKGTLVSFVGSRPVKCQVRRLPHEDHFRGTCIIEVLPGSPLKLIHPARQEFVKDEHYEKLIEKLDLVRLSDAMVHGHQTPTFKTWSEWRETYPTLPEPRAGRDYVSATHVFGPDASLSMVENLMSSLNRQTREFKAQGICLVSTEDDYAGYSWYDALRPCKITLKDSNGECHDLGSLMEENRDALGLESPEFVFSDGLIEISSNFSFLFYGYKGAFDDSSLFVFAFDTKEDVDLLCDQALEYFECDSDHEREEEDFLVNFCNYFREHTGMSVDQRLEEELRRKVGGIWNVNGLSGRRKVVLEYDGCRLKTIKVKKDEDTPTDTD